MTDKRRQISELTFLETCGAKKKKVAGKRGSGMLLVLRGGVRACLVIPLRHPKPTHNTPYHLVGKQTAVKILALL